MIEFNDIIFTQIGNMNSLNLLLFIVSALILSVIIDIVFGELPGKIHPVVIMGLIINFFKNIF